ncbi:endonuclease/exonuclease/phosphatase family protein [Glycomyces tarimensis]
MRKVLSRRNVLGAGLALGATAVANTALTGTAHAQDAAGHGALIGPPSGDRIHLLTFNLRYEGGNPSPHTWEERRPRVKTVLRTEQPTILFTQEGLYGQLQDVLADLRGYDWVHLGRLGGSQSEATAIMWVRDRLKVLEYDHLWLSDTPRLIGSKGWGNNVVRMLTWVRFEDLRTGRDFYVVNNHFDHQSEDSRQRGAHMNLEVIAPWDAPVIVAGDFNNTPDTAIHRILTDGGLVDTMLDAEQQVTPVYGTWNGWDPVPSEEARRIDWIMATPDVRIHQAGVNTYSKKGLTPSDHWPAQALISL